jgi:PAS domain-containing protein
MNAAEVWLQTVGLAALVALALMSAGLLAVGVGHLAERPFTPRQRRIGAVALLGLGLGLLPVGLPLALVVPAGLNVLVGAAAAAWLWGRGGAERLAGLLLVLLALNALQVFAFGDVVAERQSLVAALIRLCMGLTLLHAAGRRSAEASRVARERFMRLTEHSHQGVAVVRGEQLLYANPALLRIYGLNSLEDVRTLWRDATMPEAEAPSAERAIASCCRRTAARRLDRASASASTARRSGCASRPGVSTGTAMRPSRWSSATRPRSTTPPRRCCTRPPMTS